MKRYLRKAEEEEKWKEKANNRDQWKQITNVAVLRSDQKTSLTPIQVNQRKNKMWPTHAHFIFLILLIMSMAFVLSLTQMLVFLSFVWYLAYFFPFWSVQPQVSLFCAYLVSVQGSAPYAIAGSTHALYIISMSLRANGEETLEMCIGVLCEGRNI